MATHPTPAQITAVQHALYRNQRLHRMNQLLHQLATTMNVNPATEISPNDVRNPAGSGPQWFFPDSGNTDSLVIDGAQICDQIASAVLEMRQDIQNVSFPDSDKGHLSKALSAEAASWSARAAAWRAPKNADVDVLVDSIQTHVQTAAQEAAQVHRYLKTKRELGF